MADFKARSHSVRKANLKFAVRSLSGVTTGGNGTRKQTESTLLAHMTEGKM